MVDDAERQGMEATSVRLASSNNATLSTWFTHALAAVDEAKSDHSRMHGRMYSIFLDYFRQLKIWSQFLAVAAHGHPTPIFNSKEMRVSVAAHGHF